MDINLEYYKIFYYVAKYNNFTKAANALGNSQPNITRAMNCLESAAQCKLFVRTNRGVRLTFARFRKFEGFRFFDGEPSYLGEAPNKGVSDYWFGRIFPHSYIVRGTTADGKYFMNLFVDTMSGKIVQLSTEAKADETDTPSPGGDVTVETGNGTETFHTYNNYDDILPDGMTVDKFCTLLAKYWGFSGYRLAQTDDAMFHYAQLNPGGGELLTDFAGANSYLTVYFDGDQSGTPMYISLDRFPGRVNVLFGMLHQVG